MPGAQDSAVYAGLFSDPEIAEHFSDAVQVRAMLDFLAEQFRGERPVHREPDRAPPPGVRPAPLARAGSPADDS